MNSLSFCLFDNLCFFCTFEGYFHCIQNYGLAGFLVHFLWSSGFPHIFNQAKYHKSEMSKEMHGGVGWVLV